MAQVYYGKEFDPAKHFNALPRSARKVFAVNNYLPSYFADWRGSGKF
jgi:hypothetical protein